MESGKACAENNNNVKSENVVAGIDLERYCPVEPLTYYGEYAVSRSGSYNCSPHLPGHIIDFIQKLHSDMSLWDGKQGILGRDYISHRAQTLAISLAEAEQFRAQYLQLKADISPRAGLDKLRKSLDRQSHTLAQLHQSVLDMQRKKEKLCRHRDYLEMTEGQTRRVQDLEDRLTYYSEELQTLKQAESQMKRKVWQTETDVFELETGYVRRIALLRRIFGEEPLRGGLLLGYCQNAEMNADLVNQCDEKSMKASRSLFQAKCFYLDCLTGKAHLYKVENTLRAILENLQEVMSSFSTGHDVAVTRHRSTEWGPDFRIRYIRKLWNSIDADFKAALPYIGTTSLMIASNSEREDSNGPALTKQFSFTSSGNRAYSIFNRPSCILPSFTIIELLHPLNKKSKVSALHKAAARLYKEVNLVYDTHEDMVQKTLAMFQRRIEEDRKATEDLISKWESLLGV